MDFPEKWLADFEYIPLYAQDEALVAVHDALTVGAKPPLTFVGIGATAVVLCDQRNHAFKVARQKIKPFRSHLRDEFEFLTDAYKQPSISKFIARPYKFHLPEIVIERECPMPAQEGLWIKHSARNVYEKIVQVMQPLGWGGPEFKTDSFVLADRGFVLVDAGFVYRLGDKLAGHIQDILSGKTWPGYLDTPHDLMFALRRELDLGVISVDTFAVLTSKLKRASWEV